MTRLNNKAAFKNLIKVGQFNFPDWSIMEEMVDGIFERKYYTNHGPLLQELESKLESFFEVDHVICMTNIDIASMISLKALDINGEVLIPAFSHISIAQSLVWAGLTPVFCDSNKNNPHINIKEIKSLINENTSAILGVNNWGDICNVNEIEELSKENKLKTFFYSTDVIGQKYQGKRNGGFGDLEVFSFDESNIINGADGACVCTNNEETAARLRNIRSSYGSGKPVSIPYTGNGRMSEIQAGVILHSLKGFNNNIGRNKKIYDYYISKIEKIEGLSIFTPASGVDSFNYQKVVLLVDQSKYKMTPKLIQERLFSENVETISNITHCISPFKPYNRISEMTNSNLFIENSLLLPNNSKLTTAKIDVIVEILSKHNL